MDGTDVSKERVGCCMKIMGVFMNSERDRDKILTLVRASLMGIMGIFMESGRDRDGIFC